MRSATGSTPNSSSTSRPRPRAPSAPPTASSSARSNHDPHQRIPRKDPPMHTLMVLYGEPTDPEKFREYYQHTHLQIARKLPGVRATRHSINLAAAEGESPFIAVFEAD